MNYMERRIALTQDNNMLIKFEHFQQINRAVLSRRKKITNDLFWEYQSVVEDLKQTKKWVEGRFNIFRWLDKRTLKRVQKRFDDVVARAHALGIRVEGVDY